MAYIGAEPIPVVAGGTGLASTTANQILYSSATSTIAGLATANNGTLITSGGGVPSISSTLPTAVQGNITSTGTLGNQLNSTRTCFQAYLTANATNVTGDGTTYTVAYNGVSFDQGSNFAANTFTAPVTGRYFLCANFELTGLTASHTRMFCEIACSAVSIGSGELNVGAVRTDQNVYAFSMSGIVRMNANDTATVTIQISNGAKVVNVTTNGSSDPRSLFCGYLLC